MGTPLFYGFGGPQSVSGGTKVDSLVMFGAFVGCIIPSGLTQYYFPEPVTVPGNVAEAKHKVRVQFVRRVSVAHVGCALAAVFVGWFWNPGLSPVFEFSALGVCLVLLTLVRRFFQGDRLEVVFDVLLAGPTVCAVGLCARALHESGWPVVALIPAAVGVALYGLCCGNDFSYIGQFVVSAGLTVLCVVGMVALGWLTPAAGVLGCLQSCAYLFYFAYDLSMLVKRRRAVDLLSAPLDLFRDLLNFLTYPVRAYWHWRRYKFL